ncbi:unnamed protein product, partial [Anisakis simplex]|uniref:Uncharacterized protein n=1 Tax=Anisakis simplex TaxID=6269 RepID=A0A0M3JNI9_ANISI
MNNDMNAESSGSISSGIVASGIAYRAMELELSDDGSSVVSDAEAEHPAHGKRRSSAVKQRKGSGNSASQLSPSLGAGSAYHHPLGSPLSSYPVSIRQQLAIIKQVEFRSNHML